MSTDESPDVRLRNQAQGFVVSRLMTNFLTKHAAENKSGALLLTVFG